MVQLALVRGMPPRSGCPWLKTSIGVALLEASLRRLQTDSIELYQVHGWDGGSMARLHFEARALWTLHPGLGLLECSGTALNSKHRESPDRNVYGLRLGIANPDVEGNRVARRSSDGNLDIHLHQTDTAWR
jgi:hypothetical protein